MVHVLDCVLWSLKLCIALFYDRLAHKTRLRWVFWKPEENFQEEKCDELCAHNKKSFPRVRQTHGMFDLRLCRGFSEIQCSEAASKFLPRSRLLHATCSISRQRHLGTFFLAILQLAESSAN